MASPGPASTEPGPVPAAAEPDADEMITAIYRAQYRSLVRLAALLVGDAGAAEAAVQDSFVAVRGASRQLRDRDKALSYLRRSVVIRSRSVRRRVTPGRNESGRAPQASGGGQGPIMQPGHSAVISALGALPPRQREALVLRFYLDLPEAQAASAMGISPDAVTRHTARAMAALSGVLTPGS
jgi:RNA polymerase sigma factor (sigma-70 family)